MLDAHATHIKVVGHALSLCKPAHDQTLLGRLDVLVWGKVVSHHHHAVGIEYTLRSELCELADGDRRGDVVAENDIHLDVEKLASPGFLDSSVRSQNLL
jgi:hypothetical protein